MTKYREILRLLGNGLKTDEIVQACSVSKKTVVKVKKRAAELEISWPLAPDMTDEKLAEIMFPKPPDPVSTKRMPDFDYVRRELLRNGVNKKLLWTEYLEQCRREGADALMYSQFCYYIQQDEQKRRATMHIPRKPGLQIEVDWAGDPAYVIDRDTGEAIKMYVFVAAMSYSTYAYAEAFPDMKQASWIKANVHMLEFIGGVPRMIIPDNTSTAVNHNGIRKEREINPSYQEFAEHYNTAIIPARVRRPKDYRQKSVIGNLSLKRNKYGPFQTEKPRRFPITFHPRPQKWSRYSSLPFHFFSGTDSVFPVSSFSGRAS